MLHRREFDDIDRRLRRLAATLVADEASADDLVQEAWVTALERSSKVRRLDAWLASVLRNLANRERGRAERRRQIEALSTEREVVSSGVTAVEDASTAELLRSATEQVREPYREVLLAHFFEGRTVPEVAAQLGRPFETVKSQVRRGLAELRDVLDRKHGGDRVAWSALLISFARPEPGGAASRAPSKRTQLRLGALATTAGALLLGAAWFDAEPAGGVSLVERDGAREPVAAPSTLTAPRGEPTARVAVADGPAVANATTTEPRAIDIHVRRPDGSLATAVEVRVLGEDAQLLDELVGDEAGRVRVQLHDAMLVGPPTIPPPDPGLLVVAREAGGAWSLRHALRLPSDRDSVVIPSRGPGQAIVGQVLDERQRPVAGVEVVVMRERITTESSPEGDSLSEVVWRTSTDTDGRYELTGLPRRVHQVLVRGAGMRAATRFVGGDEPVLAADFALEPGAVVRGTVRGVDGAVVPNAVVWAWEVNGTAELPGPETRTDASGRYVLAGLAPGERLLFAAREAEPAASGPWAAAFVDVASGGEETLWDPWLAERDGLRVRVLEASTGAPVPDAAVVAVSTEEPRWRAALFTDAEGRAHFPHVPDAPLAAAVERYAGAPGIQLFHGLRAAGEELVVELAPVAEHTGELSGVLEGAAGLLLAPAVVIGCSEAGMFQTELDDETGAFHLGEVPGGSYRLWAVVEGLGPVGLGEVDVHAGDVVDLGLVRAPAPLRVELVWGGAEISADSPWVLSTRGPCDGPTGKRVLMLKEPRPTLELFVGDYLLCPASPVDEDAWEAVAFEVRPDAQGMRRVVVGR